MLNLCDVYSGYDGSDVVRGVSLNVEAGTVNRIGVTKCAHKVRVGI